MNATLEPREVNKPFAQRWLRDSLLLLLRSPVRFVILIGLLGWLDTLAVNLTNGVVVEKVWVDRLGTLMLPFLWVLVSAVARGADDNQHTWQALAQLRRRSVWIGALVTGVSLAALNWTIYSVIHGVGVPPNPPTYLQHQGQFLGSIEASVMLMSLVVGPCFFPLLVLVSKVSPLHARQLSRKASDINGWIVIMMLILILDLGAIALASAVPAYGMTTAACLVFFGVLNYVAYRDIFGRRGESHPKEVINLGAATDAKVARALAVAISDLKKDPAN
jgi:hypothetical protein